MGWAIGQHEGRWIGYGVPATCDHPGCDAAIDRGLEHRCGDVWSDAGCTLFFCGAHLPATVEEDGGHWVSVCERCDAGEPPFDPKPDTVEWVKHMLSDASWAQWRDENQDKVKQMRESLVAA